MSIKASRRARADKLRIFALVLSIGATGTGVWYYLDQCKDYDKIWAIILLCIPALAFILQHQAFPRVSVLAVPWEYIITACAVLQACSIGAYATLSRQEPRSTTLAVSFPGSEVLVWVNLIGSLVIAGLAFHAVASVLARKNNDVTTGPASEEGRSASESESGAMGDLSRSLRIQPTAALCFFLLLFLYTTYLLALSLALHDRLERIEHNRIALHAESFEQQEQLLPIDVLLTTCATAGHRSFDLRFSAHESILQYEATTFEDLARPTTFEMGTASGGAQSECSAFLDKKRYNACRLHEISELLWCFEAEPPAYLTASTSAMWNKGEDQALPMVLAERRLASVRTTLPDLIARKSNLAEEAWRIQQKSSKDSRPTTNSFPHHQVPRLDWTGFIETEATLDSKAAGGGAAAESPEEQGWDPRATVEVRVGPLPDMGRQHPSVPIARTPDLLDYLYFMVYTITTTGYGDLKPVNGFAKFITTLANLYEVFFVVVFFNVMISASREDKRRASKPAQTIDP